MVLHAALPQVLAGALFWCLETVRTNFIILITDAKHKVSSLVVDLRYPRPVVVGDGRFVPQHHDPARCQSEEVLHAVLSQHRMQIDTVHVVPFHLVQIVKLGLGR
uniref:Putative secreted protein n=1 Tax=Anopheles triannulatus TaxID=58253 RepID=A0A2M4B1A1_9DIPT